MKLKVFGLTGFCVAALLALSVSSASATTFEIQEVTYNQSTLVSLSLAPGTTLTLKTPTGEYLINTCKESQLEGITTSPYSDSTVTMPLTNLTFSGCQRMMTVHKPGQLYLEHIPGSTDGTVVWENAELTFTFGSGQYPTPVCKTGAGVDIGIFTGTNTGQATLDVNAVINCGFLFPALVWKGTYVVTLPSGLGVSA